jgi:hypothetical protein
VVKLICTFYAGNLKERMPSLNGRYLLPASSTSKKNRPTSPPQSESLKWPVIWSELRETEHWAAGGGCGGLLLHLCILLIWESGGGDFRVRGEGSETSRGLLDDGRDRIDHPYTTSGVTR